MCLCLKLTLLLLKLSVVGRKPQGTLQGLFASAGSLARIIFPIASGYISKLFGLEPLLVFIIVVILICAAITVRHKKILEKLTCC